ncbi:MAG: hypothetical protein HYY24_02325 [Verrucomicrobia bacterium]|nr:hypothetical protein [Verrucomicrobiota bacterium]
MKTLACLAALLLGLLNAPGQDAQTIVSKPQVQSADQKRGKTLTAPRPKPVALPGERKIEVKGFLPEVAATKKPLRALNPFDPKNPGPDGRNVSFDPLTGQPQGFKLISLEF